jgi:Zn-dependent alcohol dehydrogenase
VPHDTPDVLCSLLGCGLTTAFGVIDNETNLKFGESVAIVGCGGVGLNLIQGAAMRSAYPIIAIDINEKKREKSLKMNADLFINSSTEKLSAILKNHVPQGIDVIIDTTGNANVLKEMPGYLSNQGRLVMVGQPAPGVSLEIPNALDLFNGSGKIIIATQGGQTHPNLDIPRYLKLHKSGKLNFKNLISHSFKLEQINEAFDLLRSGDAGRIIINISESFQ